MRNNVVRFFEYQRVKFNLPFQTMGGKCELTFSARQTTALRKFHTLSDGLYFDLIDNGIQFKEQVGVIQVGSLTIEVLPKIDRSDDDLNQWHDVLLDMLKECHLVDPTSTGYANLKLRHNSVLELYFEKYVVELELLLHRGLVKRYRTMEGNQTTLKGNLQFAKHLQNNLTHAERFFVNYTVFDDNHKLHQILFQALEVIDELTDRTLLSDRVKGLLTQWPQSGRVHISQGVFNSILMTRKTEPYQQALLIAKMILLNYHPDLRGGKESVLALMFNMNELWEKFIYRRLKLIEKQLNWKVTAQMGLKYWIGENCTKKLIPDIIIRQLDSGTNVVLDTKWKRPPGNKPDDHDLRQLLSYKLYFEGDKAFLVYPSVTFEVNAANGAYSNQIHLKKSSVFKEGFGLHGGLLFVNILNRKKLIERTLFINSLIKLLS